LVHPKGETDRKIAAPEINRKDGSHSAPSYQKSELTESDALIVKTYVISASRRRFVVPVGDVLSTADESKIR
jgi:hypothetical protein